MSNLENPVSFAFATFNEYVTVIFSFLQFLSLLFFNFSLFFFLLSSGSEISSSRVRFFRFEISEMCKSNLVQGLMNHETGNQVEEKEMLKFDSKDLVKIDSCNLSVSCSFALEFVFFFFPSVDSVPAILFH